MYRIGILTWKDLYLSNTNRTLFVIRFVTPFLLSAIIAFAFSGIGGGSLDLNAIPVAIVNQDTGTEVNGQDFNLGDTFVMVFLPGEAEAGAGVNESTCDLVESVTTGQSQGSLADIITATKVDTPEAARAGVDNGTYQAAVIIPPDFSQNLSPQFSAESVSMGESSVEVYASGGSVINGSIVRSIVQSISNQLLTGNVTIAATIQTLIDRATEDAGFGLSFAAASASGTFQPDFGCAFNPAMNIVSIDRIPLNAAQQQSAFVQILIMFSAAQAAFFALFTAQFGMLSLFDEQKQGTLQRILVAPIPSRYILLAKLLAVFLDVLLQLTVLLLALTLLASVHEGELIFIWGSNPLLVVLTLVTLALSMCGVGALVVGLSRTPEQARLFGPILNAGLGALGGSFGFVPPVVSVLSPIYWGSSAFQQLSAGNTDIGLNLVILLVQGAVTFVIGSWLFNRRVGL